MYQIKDSLRSEKFWNAEYENGRQIIVVFNGFTSEPAACELISDTIDPIKVSTTGVTVNFSRETIRPYGKSLMFDSIPFDFLYGVRDTNILKVGDGTISALCLNHDCDYSYVAHSSEPKITKQTYDDKTTSDVYTLKLSITDEYVEHAS